MYRCSCMSPTSRQPIKACTHTHTYIHQKSLPISHNRTDSQGTYTQSLPTSHNRTASQGTHTIPAYIPQQDSRSGHIHTIPAYVPQQDSWSGHAHNSCLHPTTGQQVRTRKHKRHLHLTRSHTHTHTQSPPMSHKRMDGQSTHKTRQGLIYYSQQIEQLQMSIEDLGIFHNNY